jgi:hypothetical protein
LDQARNVLVVNLAKNATAARDRMAMSLEAVSKLTGLPLLSLRAVEDGHSEVDLSLNQLMSLALFLGLSAKGTPRAKLPGSN